MQLIEQAQIAHWIHIGKRGLTDFAELAMSQIRADRHTMLVFTSISSPSSVLTSTVWLAVLRCRTRPRLQILFGCATMHLGFIVTELFYLTGRILVGESYARRIEIPCRLIDCLCEKKTIVISRDSDFISTCEALACANGHLSFTLIDRLFAVYWI